MSPHVLNALTALRQGQVILYPTETVWGIGCDATHESAIKKIMRLKGRQDGKPFILLIESVNILPEYLAKIPDNAINLLNSSVPQTVIFPEGKNVSPLAMGSDGSIAFRIAKNSFCMELLKEFKKPIVSTSANFSGKSTPKSFHEIDPLLISKVDYVVEWEYENSDYQKPSGIVKIMDDGS
ncbi:MAG: threonylcarbamoyl-AMP synthase, partial [Bacteroidetes bacterium RIFCSPLOWO2_02_FULL_36_8]